MAPPGAGGSSGALDAVYDNPYRAGSSNSDYNKPIFTDSERTAMRTMMAFACILIAGALVAFIMVVLKSWLSNNGKRNKSRLSVLVLCLVFVVVGRAVTVTDVVHTLQAPNRLSRIYDYDDIEFLVAHVFSGLFSWISDLFIFTLALFEITRSGFDAKKKVSWFEISNAVVIFLLFVITLTKWAMDTRWTMAEWMEDYWRTSPSVLRSTLAGLLTTYSVVALLFATEILLVAWSKSYPKKHHLLVILFSATLVLGQILDLAKATVYYFGTSDMSSIAFLGLSSTVDLVWTAKLLLMALLAWSSYTHVRAGPSVRIGSEQFDADRVDKV